MANKSKNTNNNNNNANKGKAKEKRYKGKSKLSLEELECYCKENKCFKCKQQGHVLQVCPKRGEKNEPPRATAVEDGYSKGSLLSYAWGKVREHDTFILFDPGSIHNFYSTKLATKLGIHDFEMGEATQADGAFKG